MRKRTLFIAILLTASASVCSAGTLNKGIWSPSSACKAEPKLPTINQATVDGYNKSVELINDWQKKVSEYNSCVVKEANEDTASVQKYALDLKKKLEDATNKVNADTKAAKEKLEKPQGK